MKNLTKLYHHLTSTTKALLSGPVRTGSLIALGFFGTTIIAVAVTGTIKTWTATEVLKSADLNTTIASLKTAIETVPFILRLKRTSVVSGTGEFSLTIENNSQLSVAYDNSAQIVIGSASTPSTTAGFSEKMRITSAGNVGIGTAGPSHILHISGAGRSTQAAWDTSSDERLKDIKGSYPRGLKELALLSPITFYFKKDNSLKLPTAEEIIGISAQSLRKVLPEAVKQQNDGYLTVNNDPIFWTMVNAIKELKALHEEDKKKLSKLEEENASRYASLLDDQRRLESDRANDKQRISNLESKLEKMMLVMERQSIGTYAKK